MSSCFLIKIRLQFKGGFIRQLWKSLGTHCPFIHYKVNLVPCGRRCKVRTLRYIHLVNEVQEHLLNEIMSEAHLDTCYYLPAFRYRLLHNVQRVHGAQYCFYIA